MPPTVPTFSEVMNSVASAFPEHYLPGVIDAISTPQSLANVILRGSIVGGRDMQRPSKWLSDNLERLARLRVAKGFQIESRFKYQRVGGRAVGRGAISAPPVLVDNLSTQRWEITRAYQPIAIPDDQVVMLRGKYRAAKNRKARKQVLEGEGGIIDTVTNAVQTGMEAALVDFSTDILSDNDDTEEGFLGLAHAVSTTGTYGGVNRATMSPLQGQVLSVLTSSISDIDSTSHVEYVFGRMIELATVENGADINNLLLVVGSNVLREWRRFAQGMHNSTGPSLNYRIQWDGGKSIPGWTGDRYNVVPIMTDPSMDSNTAYLLDFGENVMFQNIEGALFDMTDWQPAERITQMWCRIMLYGQLVVRNPRRVVKAVWGT